MHKVSVREISRVTGFSPATVSNALNHKRNVSEETAEKIRSVAKSLGYQHPSQLDAIKFVVARKTGAIVDDSTFHPSVIEGVERQARRHGMGTAFVSLDFSDLDAVRPQVAAACELLGYDPLQVANEGKMVAVVPADEADAALGAMHGAPYGQNAAVIGEVFEARRAGSPCMRVRTAWGAARVLDMLVGEQLPRIC